MKRRRSKIIAVILLLAICIGTLGAAAPMPIADSPIAEPVQRVGEVMSLRQTNSETYLLSDGSYECIVYPGNKYYTDEHNTLKLIDNTLLLDEASIKTGQRNYTNTGNSFQVAFSDSRVPSVTIAKGNQSIHFQPETVSGGNQLGSATANQTTVTVGAVRNCAPLTQLADTGDNTITYTNVFQDTNFVYVLTNSAVKEYIVLNSPLAPNTFTFRFTLENLTLKAGDGIGIFLDEQNNEVFRLDQLFAMDTNEEMTDALSYTFSSIKGSRDILVTLTLDQAFLTDADRAFPVVIDPSIMLTSSKTQDASVYSANPNTNYQMDNRLRTGKSSTYGVGRTYIQYDIPRDIYGEQIDSAFLD